MKFLTYVRRGHARLGLLDDDVLVDVHAAARLIHQSEPALRGPIPSTMLDLIKLQRYGLELVEAIAERPTLTSTARVPFRECRWGAPIPTPPHLYCVAANYPRPGRTPSGRVLVYRKDPATVIGSGTAIRLQPELTLEPDYEAELGVVVGIHASRISPDQACEAVFGYTCVNDVTARDVMRRPQKWLTAKDLETFTPTGPVVVPKSAMSWPPRCTISSRVNGTVRQRADITQMSVGLPTLISDVSHQYELEPGDVIATGTPFGTGSELSPPRYLHAGDVVDIEISGIGLLSNPCV